MSAALKDFHKNVLTEDYNKYIKYYEEVPSDDFYEALAISMKEVVVLYGNTVVTELQVRMYFEQRLKYNYPIITNGGRVQFNAMSYTVIPTEYKNNFFGMGNCD